MEIKCLIVDDEELALNVLEKYIASMPTLKLTDRCDNAIEAITFLHEHQVDLMFLDLNMPELSGLEMLKTLNNPPEVILTTAYAEFALESYEYGVVDYLLKPIKLERFVKAVNRAVEIIAKQSGESGERRSFRDKTIFIKADQSTIGLAANEILFVEAYGNYLKVHTQLQDYTIRETMHNFAGQLPEEMFQRVHKSFIVNCNHIKKISGNQLFIADHEIPVGSTYKNDLMQRLK